MPSYVRQVKCEVEYDGQKVVAKLKPLLFTDAMKLREARDDEQATLLYASLLPQYVIDMTPLLDVDGLAVPLDEALAATFYAGLVAKLMALHINAASVPNPSSPAAAPAG